ncbi:VPS10 domain-containing protein [Aequorivita marina]|uniref:T9SS type A sorting domain-containing protein n=1 Tax=Aequorivita marina TaxID=3073654 RepID=UPI0028760395|nr:T9SS type A sorting domain-containing protein [Aequorivita sp. S2608]MDS1297971.1 T9SS type A sorting domain-containing protein [Aequorivita sp. S2608]
MKKLLFYVTVVFALVMNSKSAQSQITFEGSDAYGRIYDITFHPTIENKLYALTQGSHLIESIDKGENWEIIYSFPENGVQLERLKVLSNNSLTFTARFSGVITNNALYFFNTDTGEITKQYTPPITSGSEKVWIDSYSVYSENSDIALVHQGYQIGFNSFAKVYYTSDGGANWELVYFNEDHDGVFPNNVAISPNNSEKLFIARGIGPSEAEGGLFISTDAGTTWEEKIPGNAYGPITFHPQNPETMLLGTDISYSRDHVENLYRSNDGGDTWNTIPISWSNETLDNIVSITYNQQNPDTSIVLEENEIVITYDDWETWENYVYPVDNPNSYYYGLHASYNPFQRGEVFINANYHPLLSEDGGETFTQFFNPFYPVATVALHEGIDPHFYYGVQRGLIHLNMTTGDEQPLGLQPLDYVFSGDAPVYYADRLTTGRVYKYESGFTGSSLNVSDDHGENYSFLYNNFNDKLINLATDPNNTDVIWASFLNEGGKIIDFSDISNPLVTSVPLPEADVLTDVFIDEGNSSIVYITIGAHVYRSDDGGATWEDKSNGLNIDPTTDVIFDIEKSPFNAEEFTVTTSNGIYKTTDNAETWTRTHQADNVRKIKYSTLNQNHAVASIHSYEFGDAQLLYTKDGGEVWEAVPFEAIAHAGSSSMAYIFHENSVDVYLATYDLGLIKYTIDLMVMGTSDLNSSAKPFMVYPNPTNSIINIKENEGAFVSVVIYNSLGQQVISASTEKQINISQLKTGVYFVKIKDVNGSYFIKRIIKE